MKSKQENLKNHVVGVRVESDLKLELLKESIKRKETVSDYVRTVLKDSLEK